MLPSRPLRVGFRSIGCIAVRRSCPLVAWRPRQGPNQIMWPSAWRIPGEKSYETAERTSAQEVEVEYTRARREHLASWSTALAARDVDQLWELWCRAAETALGLPTLSRGRLLLGNQQLLEFFFKRCQTRKPLLRPCKQQDTVANLKVKLLDTGACTFFEWPAFLG
eukprot:1186225-Amphidinium_carterae.1